MIDEPLHTAVVLARAQGGVLRHRQALDAGLSPRRIRDLVARGDWHAPFRGVLLLASADPVLGPVRAALLAHPDAVVRGPTAARLHGFRPWRVNAPVDLLLPPGRARRQRPGTTLRWGDPGAVVEVEGTPVTSPARTLADLVLEEARRDRAVTLMDAALRTGRVGVAEARLAAAGRRGCRRAEPWWALADARSESPLETRLRLLLADAGLPPEELQWTVRDSAGRPAARLDLAYPTARLAIEADGERFHSAPPALFRDRRRQNALVAGGWTVLRYTWVDVAQRQSDIVDAVATVLAAASVLGA